MSYEKDKLDSYVTSGSLSTALAPYATSASVSAAISAAVGSIDLSAYVSSNSLSAAVATDVLTVRGTASVSATLSAGAVTVLGRPLGAVLLGFTSQTNASNLSFSGSWSDIFVMQLYMLVGATAAATPTIDFYTDGGTTSILTLRPVTTLGLNVRAYWDAQLYGANGPIKFATARAFYTGSGVGASDFSATTTAATVNCVRFTITATASIGVFALYGWRNT